MEVISQFGGPDGELIHATQLRSFVTQGATQGRLIKQKRTVGIA